MSSPIQSSPSLPFAPYPTPPPSDASASSVASPLGPPPDQRGTDFVADWQPLPALMARTPSPEPFARRAALSPRPTGQFREFAYIPQRMESVLRAWMGGGLQGAAFGAMLATLTGLPMVVTTGASSLIAAALNAFGAIERNAARAPLFEQRAPADAGERR